MSVLRRRHPAPAEDGRDGAQGHEPLPRQDLRRAGAVQEPRRGGGVQHVHPLRLPVSARRVPRRLFGRRGARRARAAAGGRAALHVPDLRRGAAAARTGAVVTGTVDNNNKHHHLAFFSGLCNCTKQIFSMTKYVSLCARHFFLFNFFFPCICETYIWIYLYLQPPYLCISLSLAVISLSFLVISISVFPATDKIFCTLMTYQPSWLFSTEFRCRSR